MGREEEILQMLSSEFPALSGMNIVRPRRVVVMAEKEWVIPIARYLKENAGARQLCAITGIDGELTMELIYHLATTDGIVVNVKTTVLRRTPEIDTIISLYPGAELCEKELVDLLGIKVMGLPEGYRYPLPDEWPIGEYPLRKDWKPGLEKPAAEQPLSTAGLQEASTKKAEIVEGGAGNGRSH